jgi:integrase
MKDVAIELGMSPKGISTHSMRKCFVGWLYDYFADALRNGDNCDPLIMARDAAGHKSADTTARYLRRNMEKVNRAIVAME